MVPYQLFLVAINPAAVELAFIIEFTFVNIDC